MTIANHESIRQLHEANDALLALMQANPDKSNWRSCCAPGCHHCCSELTFATDYETDYILAALTPAEREALKPAVAAWYDAAQPHLQRISRATPNYGIVWRLLNLPCPLLRDGLCSVYANRPTGCRMFHATGNPDDCRTDRRHTQKFANLDQNIVAGMIVARYVSEVGSTIADHLGLLLYNRLFGTNHESAVAEQLVYEPDPQPPEFAPLAAGVVSPAPDGLVPVSQPEGL